MTISAVQCWTSMEEFFGVVPCTIMSMMSDNLIPSACEVDVPGTLSMYMLALASGTPSALLDWNNNYGSHPDKCVCFHCSNLPKHFFKEVRMDYQEIIAGTVGKENTFGTCVGRVKAGAMSYRALLHRRPPWHRARLHGRRAASPTIRSKLSAARAWRRFRSCRSCSSSFAAKASSITWPPTSAMFRRPFTKLRAISGWESHYHPALEDYKNRQQGIGNERIRGRVGIRCPSFACFLFIVVCA